MANFNYNNFCSYTFFCHMVYDERHCSPLTANRFQVRYNGIVLAYCNAWFSWRYFKNNSHFPYSDIWNSERYYVLDRLKAYSVYRIRFRYLKSSNAFLDFSAIISFCRIWRGRFFFIHAKYKYFLSKKISRYSVRHTSRYRKLWCEFSAVCYSMGNQFQLIRRFFRSISSYLFQSRIEKCLASKCCILVRSIINCCCTVSMVLFEAHSYQSIIQGTARYFFK